MNLIDVDLPDIKKRSYPIHIKHGLLGELPSHLQNHSLGNHYTIITDTNVKDLYGNTLYDRMHSLGLNVGIVSFPPGEASKSMEVVETLVENLPPEMDRSSTIIAVGGGVTGDLAGFVASIYMRGIRYIQVPTTLLAQVDSSVGGKTGVNTSQGKNMVGTFHQPSRVYIDPTTLTTLPRRDIKTGIAEAIKCGVIGDPSLFRYIEDHVQAILNKDIETLTTIIAKCVKFKASVVERDETEEGLRVILNYGHTLAHAIEIQTEFNVTHGEAVSMGMRLAGKLALEKGLWTQQELKKQNALLDAFDYPRILHKDLDIQALLQVMKTDKKAEQNEIFFVLPCTIGEMATHGESYKFPINPDELRQIFKIQR